MKRRLLLTFTIMQLNSFIYCQIIIGGLEPPVGQSTQTVNLPPKPGLCANGGFELNSLAGWNQYCGVFSDPINTLLPCADPLRAKVVGVGSDPYCGTSKVFSGNYTLKLGNNSNGAQTDLVYFPITVTALNKNFKFRYAAVLEDPIGHEPSQKPSFSYWCNLGNKNYPTSAPPDMGLFLSTIKTIVADRSNPFWTLNGQVVCKSWTCVSLDLSAYVGQTVSVCFYVKDCSLGGHFGYAYIDGLCEPDILLPLFTLPITACDNGVPIIADGTASIGEESYNWEIYECSATGAISIPSGFVASDWFVAQQVGAFNVTNWLKGKNISLKCNKYYRLRLAVQTACTPWKETTKIFKYTCPYIYNEPDKNVCCPASPCYTLGQIPIIEEPGFVLPDLGYSWSQSGIKDPIGVKPTVVVCPTSSTSYTLTVTDQNGCKNTDVVNVYFRGPLSIEILNQSGCCDRAFSLNVLEMPCSPLDILHNSTYPHTSTWTSDAGIVSTTNEYNPPSVGGTYTINASNLCYTSTKTVNINPISTFFPSGVPIIAFDQMVYDGNPMPIYQYDPTGHPTHPINWVGSPAYGSFGYRLEIYYRWNSSFSTSLLGPLARVIDTDANICNVFSNGDIKIDGYNSSGNYMTSMEQYLFKLYFKSCDDPSKNIQVTKYYHRKEICDEYQWQWFGHGYLLPTKVCIVHHYVDEVLTAPGGIFNFFNL